LDSGVQLHFDGCDATSLEVGVFGDYKDVQWFCCLFQDTEGSGQLFWVGGQQFKGLLANMGDSMVEIYGPKPRIYGPKILLTRVYR
jgi:hypothetical protein